MKRGLLGRYITAIDIGTTKICVLVAHIDANETIDIIGIGKHPSHGLKKGVVVSIAQTVNSIKSAVQEAEKMSGVKIELATVGISGGHIKSLNSIGIVAIKRQDVSQEDIDRVLESAKAIPIPQNQEILHVLPQYFRVDGQEYVFDSLGMYGVRLEAQVHIITGAVASAQNIIKSCELAGVRVTDIVLEQLASADAVLASAEREMGVGIIDIGGGTADLAIYRDGRIRHSKVIAVAGNHFTNDLSIGLGIPLEKAEELKKLFGSVTNQYWHGYEEKTVDVELGYDGGKKAVNLDTLAEILHLRAAELFELFADEINEYKLNTFMPSGIVLTGGGSLLEGISKVAHKKLEMPVRVGYPITNKNDSYHHVLPDVLKSPIYSTAYGLLLYDINKKKDEFYTDNKGSNIGKVFKRMKSWLYDFL
jgi:cell division protein FtsA